MKKKKEKVCPICKTNNHLFGNDRKGYTCIKCEKDFTADEILRE